MATSGITSEYKHERNRNIHLNNQESTPLNSHQVHGYGTVYKQVAAPCDSEDGFVTHLPCYKKCHHKFRFKVFIFCLLLILSVMDVTGDWLFYHDVAATERGLVFGPPDEPLIDALLVFAIVGSFTFICEVTNLWFEVFRDKGWIESELASAITLWVEDVPHIVISISIAACREMAISYFQLFKAAVVILSCGIRLILVFIRYCGRKALQDFDCAPKNPHALHHVIYRVFITIAMVIAFSGAVVVFLLTEYERNDKGVIVFRMPHYAIKSEHNEEKFFHNVSTYFSHPLFDYYSGHLRKADVNWLRMASIYDITKTDFDKNLYIEYDRNTRSKIVIWLSNNKAQMKAVECFEINRSARLLQNVTTTSCDTYIRDSQTTTLMFKFHFKHPRFPSLLFGDIKYNFVVKDQLNCHKPYIRVFHKIDNRIKNLHRQANAVMHYFRTKKGTSEQNHVLHLPKSTNGKFYNSRDLIDSATIWRRGFSSCTSTGSLAPHLDDNIHVYC